MSRGRIILIALIVALAAGVVAVSRLVSNTSHPPIGSGRAPERPAELGGGAGAGAEGGAGSGPSGLRSGGRQASEVRLAGIRRTLRLLRWPDRHPLAELEVGLEIDPLPEDVGEALRARTDAGGLLGIDLPAPCRGLLLRARDFEPVELAARLEESSAGAIEVELIPATGFLGRVVLADGSPVAGARVESRCLAPGWTVRDVRPRPGEPLPHPRITRAARPGPVERAVSGVQGDFWLPPVYPELSRVDGALMLSAEARDLEGELRVTLPLDSRRLPDLVVEAASEQVIRAVLEDGSPVEGVRIRLPYLRDAEWITDATGVAVLPARQYPMQVLPLKEGHVAIGLRDGEELVRMVQQVRIPAHRPEAVIVLARISTIRGRILDGETGEALPEAGVNVSFWRRPGDRAQASQSIPLVEPDGRFTCPVFGPPLHSEAYDRAEVEAACDGYRSSGPIRVALSGALRDHPVEVRLDPLPGHLRIRGRAFRSGEPAAGLELAAGRVGAAEDGFRRFWWGHTDGEGRFAFRRRPETDDERVAIKPHGLAWSEFGMVGPIGTVEAAASELRIDFEPARRVRARLRGLNPGARYAYYVSLLGGDVAVPYTVNGTPLTGLTGEEDEIDLLLSDRVPSQVTIGVLGEGLYRSRWSNAAFYDPARPIEPLELRVEPLFRAAGRVSGASPGGPGSLWVGLRMAGGSELSPIRVDAEGGFLFEGLLPGEYVLHLVRWEPRGQPASLGWLEVDLRFDRTDLLLAPDPARVGR